LGVVGDVSITHPFTGKGRKQAWGQYQPRALDARHAAKTGKYYADHRRVGYLFVPLVATTYGRVSADSAILCHVLAHEAAVHFYTSRRWTIESDAGYTKSFLLCRSRFATRFKARVGRSVCAAAGYRGLISAAPTPPSVADAIRVSELDYGEDLPLGPFGARAA
jgi:hypothetical protein